VRLALLTVSDTRTEATDTSGAAMAELLAAGGHVVVERAIVRDEPSQVRSHVERWLARDDVDVVVTSGGTGITSRDSTFEALSGLFEKTLDGFGELFRFLSFQDIGPAAMLSRAAAGVVRGRVIVLLPGSEAAVRLAMSRLLVPELGHLVREVRR
jgi:molybdenum cofactor biosynthesis protein B